MAPVDSMLKLFVDHGADELRLSADETPRMFQRGKPMRLILPMTSDGMLRQLLGELVTEEREARLRAGGGAEFDYAPDVGNARFHVALKLRGNGGLEAIFRAGGTRVTPPAPPLPITRASSIAPITSTPADDPPLSLAIPTAAAPPAPMVVKPQAIRSAHSLPGALAALLSEARLARASDLHLQDGAIPMVRVDGSLRALGADPIGALASLLAELPDEAVRAAIAGERAYDGTIDFEDRRVRLHVYRSAEGAAAALRLLPGAAPALSALHLPLDLTELALLSNGLVIVCGPTGSGKSATLAALAQEALRRRAALLVTLEDPIEYRVQPGDRGGGIVRQRQIGRDVRDFPTGLKDALREDPDVLLVGEMRDSESVALALTAAETGHLVLASLHSRSAASAIERIVDACHDRREGEVRSQLSLSLRAVVSQRLIPKERGGGRVAALELLRVNHNVASLIRDGKTAQLGNALVSSRKDGMQLLETNLAELVRAGTISRESAIAAANDPTVLIDYLTGRGGHRPE